MRQDIFRFETAKKEKETRYNNLKQEIVELKRTISERERELNNLENEIKKDQNESDKLYGELEAFQRQLNDMGIKGR